MKDSLIVILFIILAVGCIDPIDPDYSQIENENRVVIDAGLSVQDSIYEILIYRTYAVGGDLNSEVESGAEVFIRDITGADHYFQEPENGTYSLSSSILCFEQDQSYQLFVNLRDGSKYSSTAVRVPKKAKFEEIEYRLSDKSVVVDNEEVFIQYIDFFGINNTDRNSPLYYQVSYEGFFALYPPNQGSSICWAICLNQQDQIPPDLSASTFCYAPDNSRAPLNVMELRSDNLEVSLLSMPADFKFVREYSMNLVIKSISKQHYDFVGAQANQLSYGGGLFDPPPTNIIGNIANPIAPEEYALGNFSIANSYKERIYVSQIGEADYTFCDYEPGGDGCAVPPFDYCCDCRQYPGAVTTRPSFFPEI